MNAPADAAIVALAIEADCIDVLGKLISGIRAIRGAEGAGANDPILGLCTVAGAMIDERLNDVDVELEATGPLRFV